MTVEEWALVASVAISGAWSGLMATLTTILHPMMTGMSGADFARFLRAFLPTARTAPFNYIAVIGMVVAPVVAVIGLADDPGAAPFALTVAGLALTVAGPLLVSRLAAEPNYDVMLAWDPNALPEDWRTIRGRYFAINWLRAVATWVAFGLFLAALVTLL